MRTLKKSSLSQVIILSFILLITSLSAATSFMPGDEKRSSFTTLISNAQKNMNTFKAMGISELKCRDCSFTIMPNDDEKFWNFKSEPKIMSVVSDGPAAGKLEKGDEIVAIDGMLITTRRAGKRLAAIKPGDTVDITVRRGRGTITETIIAEEPNSKDEFVIEGFDEAFTLDIGQHQLSKAVESLAQYASVLSKSLPDPPEFPDSIGLFEVPALRELATIAENLTGDYLPRGWFGFRLSFGGSITRTDDGPAQWRFNEPPEIESVAPDSPADQAGLRSGDELTRIDGKKLTSKTGGKLFSEVVPGQAVTWTVKRNSKNFEVEIAAIERPVRTDVPSPVSGAVPVSEHSTGPHKLRYTGSLGETAVEVTGDDSVEVTVDKGRGVIIIKSRGATVRLKLSSEED